MVTVQPTNATTPRGGASRSPEVRPGQSKVSRACSPRWLTTWVAVLLLAALELSALRVGYWGACDRHAERPRALHPAVGERVGRPMPVTALAAATSDPVEPQVPEFEAVRCASATAVLPAPAEAPAAYVRVEQATMPGHVDAFHHGHVRPPPFHPPRSV